MVPPQERLFKKDYARQLLRIAKSDLAAAAALRTTTSGRPEIVLFLAQQAIEKALKAALCHLRLPVPFIHELGALVAKIPADKHPPGGYDLGLLDPYATVRRYEESMMILEDADLDAGLAAGHAVIAWAEGLGIVVAVP